MSPSFWFRQLGKQKHSHGVREYRKGLGFGIYSKNDALRFERVNTKRPMRQPREEKIHWIYESETQSCSGP